MQSKKIILLASNCQSSRWVYHALKNLLPISHVIIEQPVSKIQLFKRRIKKNGLWLVTGQAMFTILVTPLLRWKAKNQKDTLIKKYQLVDIPFNEDECNFVTSINDEHCRQLLKQYKPDIVIVNGTRIISNATLQSVDAAFINIHAGITPQYRGAHGGYWALYNNDNRNFGTTIHLIDAGIDTGAVLKHVFAQPGNDDNFTTYPIIQVAEGIKSLPQVIIDFIDGRVPVSNNVEKGKMYYQPTIWQYLTNKTR
ncbi:MAG: hypothetical protein KF741_03930 [Ferruginibacter sp.]|nr:formyl transferase [Bacteroidota bacterium]MBX2918371.1 hypothetical protein [Ferruginibacter sp.]